jgi:hypothetical protein
MEINRDICVGKIDGVEGPYGYRPGFGAGIAFCVVFGISMLLHIYSSIRYKTWWQFIFVVGALGKVAVSELYSGD